MDTSPPSALNDRPQRRWLVLCLGSNRRGETQWVTTLLVMTKAMR